MMSEKLYDEWFDRIEKNQKIKEESSKNELEILKLNKEIMESRRSDLMTFGLIIFGFIVMFLSALML